MEDLTRFIVQTLPFSGTTLQKIQDVLRKEDLFVLFDPTAKVYDLGFYVTQKTLHNTGTVALIDRNILKDVLPIVENALAGEKAICPERCRIGAAVMAFLQAGDILIEPSIALYEQRPNAERELGLFRCADNIEPALYAALADGSIDSIPRSSLPALDPEAEKLRDGSQGLLSNQAMRIAMLKLTEIDLSDCSPLEKMGTYLDWLYWTFCMAMLPMFVACRQFAPGHLQRGVKPLLRGHRGEDREKALRSVENALWDIQLIKEWTRKVRKQKEENRLWVLCSRDAALREIARAVHNVETPETKTKRDPLEEYFVRYWGEKDGVAFVRTLRVREGVEKENPGRRCNQLGFVETWDGLAQKSRERIRAWHPSR
jgi:hypothetical protein